MIMQIEYEAKFLDIDKDEVRERLRKAGAELVRPEYEPTPSNGTRVKPRFP